MSCFEEAYQFVAANGGSPDLEPLLREAYAAIVLRPADLQRVKEALVSLTQYLSTRVGRTAANCQAVDLFFTVDDRWSRRWSDLPPAYRQILDDMSILHDTIESPEIAANFDATPEQLLQRSEALSV